MNKHEIIQRVAEAEGVKEAEAEAVINELLALIEDRVKSGEETNIYGFGKFGRRWWKSRTGRDPQTGEPIEIEGRWIPYWSPSSTLIKEGGPHPKGPDEEAPDSAIPDKETETTETEPKNDVSERAEEELTLNEEQINKIIDDIEEAEEQLVTAEETPPDTEDEKPLESQGTGATEAEMIEEDAAEEDIPDQKEPSWEPPVRQESKSTGIFLAAAAILIIVIVAVFALRDRDTKSPDQPDMSQTDVTMKTPDEEASEPVTPESAPEEPESSTEPMTAKSLIEPPQAPSFTFQGNHRTAFQEKYDDAVRLFRDGDYLAAIVTLQRLQVSDPPDDLADNVQYWLGECRFGIGQYREAIRNFEQVFLYPETNKTADALLMMASAYIRLRDFSEAQKLLTKIQSRYPNTRYATLAGKWLRENNLN